MDVHLLQVGVPLLPVPVLHLIRLVQVVQRGLCDVHPAGGDTSQSSRAQRRLASAGGARGGGGTMGGAE